MRLLGEIYGIRIGENEVGRFLDSESGERFRYVLGNDSFGMVAGFLKIAMARPFGVVVLEHGRYLENLFQRWNRRNFHVADTAAKYEQIKPFLTNNLDIIIYNPSNSLLDSLKHILNPNQ